MFSAPFYAVVEAGKPLDAAIALFPLEATAQAYARLFGGLNGIDYILIEVSFPPPRKRNFFVNNDATDAQVTLAGEEEIVEAELVEDDDQDDELLEDQFPAPFGEKGEN